MSATSHTPKDAKVMASILKDCGIQEYEPRVINQMLEFAYRYVSDLLEDSKVYSEYAGKKQIDSDDVKLAIQMKVDNSFTSPPPKELLIEIAKEKNNQPLPTLKQQTGLRLPPDRYCLTQPNYRLKAGIQHSVATTESKPPTLRFPTGTSSMPIKKESQTTTPFAPQKTQPLIHPVQSAPNLIQPSLGPRQTAPVVPSQLATATTTTEAPVSTAVNVQTTATTSAAAPGKPLFRLVAGTETAASTSSSTASSAVKRKFEQLDEDYDNL